METPSQLNSSGKLGSSGIRHRLHYVGSGNSQLVSDYEQTAAHHEAGVGAETSTLAPDEVQHAMRDPSNCNCFDCGAEHPQWAAIRHGVFVCVRCAAHLRGLGVTLSIIRSVMLDSWTENEVQCMLKGGNAALTEVLEEAGVPADLPVREKYRTGTAIAYAARLRAIAHGEDLPAGPIPPYSPVPKSALSEEPWAAGSMSTETSTPRMRRRPGESALECWHREKYGYGSNETVCDRCLRQVRLCCECCDVYQPVPGAPV